MTKEDLENRFIKLFDLTEGFTANHFKWIINELFEQNVVIHKGDNRHPYADVIHAYAEGIEIEYKGISDIWGKATDFPSGLMYRIKPITVYEWQWYYIEDGIAKIYPEFMTYGEVTDFRHSFKIEETKRERKQ